MNYLTSIAVRIGLSLVFGIVSDLIGVSLYLKGGDGRSLVIWDVIAMSALGFVILKFAELTPRNFWKGLFISFMCGSVYLSIRTIVMQNDKLSLHFLMSLATWGGEAAIAWCVLKACLNGIAKLAEAQS